LAGSIEEICKMEFSNEVIQIELLPKAEETPLIPIDKQYFKVVMLHQLIFWLVVLSAVAIALIMLQKLQTIVLVSIVVTALIVSIFTSFRLAYLSFLNKAFAVREHDIIYQDGWLVKSLHVFPFNRIQHCSVNSGVFERRFGLSTLKIYTAGGNESDIVIPGLTVQQASALRELIIQKNKAE